MIKSPSGRRQTSWLFTSTVEQLNKGLARNKSIKWTEWDVNPGPSFAHAATSEESSSCWTAATHHSL